MKKKTCRVCKKSKPVSAFRVRSGMTITRRECRACERQWEADYKRKNRGVLWNRVAWNLRRGSSGGSDVTPAQLQALPCEDCYLCGQPLADLPKELDHVESRAAGGRTTIANIRWTHRTCNRMKHNLSLAEFERLIEVILNNLRRRC